MWERAAVMPPSLRRFSSTGLDLSYLMTSLLWVTSQSVGVQNILQCS